YPLSQIEHSLYFVFQHKFGIDAAVRAALEEGGLVGRDASDHLRLDPPAVREAVRLPVEQQRPTNGMCVQPAGGCPVRQLQRIAGALTATSQRRRAGPPCLEAAARRQRIVPDGM